jgi:hypothetical protein
MFLFYIWMIMIYAYCLFVVFFVFRRLRQGLSETLHTRLSVVRRAQTYVLGYTFFWLFPLIFSFLDFTDVAVCIYITITISTEVEANVLYILAFNSSIQNIKCILSINSWFIHWGYIIGSKLF